MFLLRKSHQLLLEILLFGQGSSQVSRHLLVVLLHLHQFLLSLCALQKRLDFEVQRHPWPVFHIAERAEVELDGENGISLSHHLNKMLPHEVSSCESLSHGDQNKQLFISHLLQYTQQTSFEEHLGVSKLVVINGNVNGSKQLLRGFLVIHECAIGTCTGIQYLVPLLEVSIWDSAWEALSTDSDALQHTVTPYLMDDQEVLHQAWTLGLVGNQATHKVRMSSVQVGHQHPQVCPESTRHSLHGTTLLLASLLCTTCISFGLSWGIQHRQQFN